MSYGYTCSRLTLKVELHLLLILLLDLLMDRLFDSEGKPYDSLLYFVLSIYEVAY